MRALAEARSNIALVKYWGKRNAALNLPAAGSLSVTLDGLTTRTSVVFGEGERDRFVLDGTEQAAEPLARVTRILDVVRERAGLRAPALVISENDFPTASGLASSASAFAALAVAATRAAGLDLPAHDLSVLARLGSGSAARSIHGGFVEMRPGEREDGDDAYAAPLLGEQGWDLRMVVAIVGEGTPKDVSSRSGMAHTARTSPLYDGWLQSVPGDLAHARAAIGRRDLAALGEVTEASAMTMHASALGARPPLLYWRGATVEALAAVREARHEGLECWATVDAGPHVKVLCSPASAEPVAARLAAVPGVTSTRVCRLGAGARVLPGAT